MVSDGGWHFWLFCRALAMVNDVVADLDELIVMRKESSMKRDGKIDRVSHVRRVE
jgi:hypothetical protein